MKKLIFHPFTGIILTLITVAILISLNKTKNKTNLSIKNIEILQTEIDNLSREVTQTQQNLDKSNQPLAKEKILRNELLMQKEGEYIVQLPDITTEEINKQLDKKQSPWQEWKKLLF